MLLKRACRPLSPDSLVILLKPAGVALQRGPMLNAERSHALMVRDVAGRLAWLAQEHHVMAEVALHVHRELEWEKVGFCEE
jgi:hypothetical protein